MNSRFGSPAKRWSWRPRVTAIGALLIVVGLLGVGPLTELPPIPSEWEATGHADGDTRERFDVAIHAKRYNDAFRNILPLAALGSVPEAATYVGLGYSSGILGTYREDHCKAVSWYYLAAKGKQIFPALMLSIHYAAGQGVKRDWALAYAWYKQAWNLLLIQPRWPDMNYAAALRAVELMLEQYHPEFRNPTVRAEFEARAKATALSEMPAPEPQDAPNIPYLGAWFGELRNQSTGCHGELSRMFDWIASVYFQSAREPWNPYENITNFVPISSVQF